MQSLIDEINQKIESGGAEGFGGGASGNQDSSTFTFQVEVLRYSGLISSSKESSSSQSLRESSFFCLFCFVQFRSHGPEVTLDNTLTYTTHPRVQTFLYVSDRI